MDTVDVLKNKKGFIVELDQSGESSKQVLVNYGYDEDVINDENIFDLIHEMRTRIMTNKSFSSEYILGTILFEDTMKRDVYGINSVTYLKNKDILSFLKIDVGLEDMCDGVRLLKDIPNIDELLTEAKKYGIVGAKMRSVIYEYNEYGIKKIVEQQFKLAKIIISHGLIPIIEPEVDINANDKKHIESYLKKEIFINLNKMKKEDYLLFKFTLPVINNFYDDLLRFKNVLRIVALSGGYSKDDACEKLKQNKKMIASFSRAFLEGINIGESDENFSKTLNESILKIYNASIKKK